MDDEQVEADAPQFDPAIARILLAGIDTIHLSAEANVSEEVRAKLDEAKEAAQLAAKENAVHCPDWLGAQVHPSGARGGYGHLIETEDFSIKVLGANIPNRPGLYVELRSLFLHTHPEGARGACEEALCWIREQLLYDQDETTIRRMVSFEGVKLSRVDLHIDWQGGWEPSPADAQNFIKPARVKWQVYSDGTTFTGIAFGRGALMARVYRKSLEVREKQNEAYLALLSERKPYDFDLYGDIWRLEFQLRREGATGFRLYREPDAGDDADAIEAELAAEDLPHIGTLPRLFTHMDALWKYLTTHTLRLVEPSEATNRSRWPLNPTWARLRDTFAEEAMCEPLDEDQRELVRGMRFEGKSRLLRRMLLGVIASLELEDASPTSAALAAISKWVDEAARREAERAEARRARYLARYGRVPAWVERGMGEKEARVRQVRHRVQMLLGIFSAQGVLPLELKPAHSVGDLLVQHLDDLEREAEDKGGIDTKSYIHALEDAVRLGLVQRNVTNMVDAPRVRQHEINPLSLEQARQFLATAQGDRLEALALLALSTGMRHGELLALRWQNVDLERGVLQVRTTVKMLYGTLVIDETKTKRSRRRIALTPSTCEALRRH